MQFNIITIFPEIFNSYFNESILKRAQKNKIVNIKIHDLRQWTDDKHRTVDDTPYGGGAGMVMKVEPIYKALRALKYQIPNTKSLACQSLPARLPSGARRPGTLAGRQIKSKTKNPKSPARGWSASGGKIILLSPKGKKWNQQLVKKYSKLNEIILICGRYEGADERIKKFVDEEISVGDYVLTGGEIPAMAIVDSIIRLLPGVLGNAASAKDESHSVPRVLEYPQYTRPEIFTARGKKYRVPKILLSGDHKKIERWREKKKKVIK